MASFQNIEVSGLSSLYQVLRTLPENVNRNVLRGATNAASQVIKNEMVLRAPIYSGRNKNADPGRLKRSVYVKHIPEQSSESVQTYYVGVRQGKRESRRAQKGLASRDAYYARYVELGTVKWAGHPFFQAAFAARKEAAIKAMQDYMAKRIPIEAERLK